MCDVRNRVRKSPVPAYDGEPAASARGRPQLDMQRTPASPSQLRGESFGRLLRVCRMSAGLTQEALAERAGLSRRGIADLERGARLSPHQHTIDKLAESLGLERQGYAAL